MMNRSSNLPLIQTRGTLRRHSGCLELSLCKNTWNRCESAWRQTPEKTRRSPSIDPSLVRAESAFGTEFDSDISVTVVPPY